MINLTKSARKVYSIPVAYPWLPPRCGICQKWGHSAQNCESSPKIRILEMCVAKPKCKGIVVDDTVTVP